VCFGGSTGLARDLRFSLVALRRRLSPGLPLSHTSEEACDPAVLFFKALTNYLASLISFYMGDDYSNELSLCRRLTALHATTVPR
jgi:hypothetical protein